MNLLWNYLHTNFSNFNLYVFGLFVSHVVSFWSVNSFFLYIDLYNPEKWKQFKIQKSENINIKKLKNVLCTVLFNQIILLPILYVGYFIIDKETCFSRELPNLFTVVIHILMFLIIEEIMFYYFHRLLHTKFIFKLIHKVHHEWISPIGIVSIYAHPLEHIFSNIIPTFAGPALFKSHYMLCVMWVIAATIVTIISHCGYNIPILFSPEAHDYHHTQFNEIFGILGVLDHIHGTDKKFKKKKLRHFISFKNIMN